MRRLLVIPLVLLVFLTGLAIACGGDDEEETSSPGTGGTASTPAAVATTPASAAPTTSAPNPPAAATSATGGATGVQEINITAGERGQEYYFSMSEIRVRPGEVRVNLRNEGPERPHTFTVRSSGGSEIVASDRVEPGSSATVTFTVNETGNYQFLCSLMGHADRGQRGTLVVAN